MKKQKSKPKDFDSTGSSSDTSANIYWSMLSSAAWKSLTAQQQQLYLYCKAQLYGQKKRPKEHGDNCFYMNQAKWRDEFELYKKGNENGFCLIFDIIIIFEILGDMNMRNKSIGYLADGYFRDTIHVSNDIEGISAINKMLDRYVEKAKETKQPEWHVKYAAIYFTYEDKYYVIYPSRLSTSSEIFENLADSIIDDLFDLGAYDMFYSGMLD